MIQMTKTTTIKSPERLVSDGDIIGHSVQCTNETMDEYKSTIVSSQQINGRRRSHDAQANTAGGAPALHCEPNGNDDDTTGAVDETPEMYTKVPVRDLISTFEKQTHPVIRYKVREDKFPIAAMAVGSNVPLEQTLPPPPHTKQRPPRDTEDDVRYANDDNNGESKRNSINEEICEYNYGGEYMSNVDAAKVVTTANQQQTDIGLFCPRRMPFMCVLYEY